MTINNRLEKEESRLVQLAEDKLSSFVHDWMGFLTGDGTYHISLWVGEGTEKQTIMGRSKLEAIKNALIKIGAPVELAPETYEVVDHPRHYGGADNPYEAIKVIEEWDLDFHLGNVVKYISRAGRKPDQSQIDDLKKAKWYLERFIEKVEENT